MENFWNGFIKRAADAPAPVTTKPAPAKPAPAPAEQSPELAEVNAKLDEILQYERTEAEEKAQIESEDEKNQAYEQGKAEGMVNGGQKLETMKGQPVQQQQTQ